MEKYIESFNEKEKKAYKIAKEFLKTSFDIEKSIGYLGFCKKQPKTDIKYLSPMKTNNQHL